MFSAMPLPHVQLAPPTTSNVVAIDAHQPAVGRVPSAIVPPPVPPPKSDNNSQHPHQGDRESRFQQATLRASSSFVTQLLTGGRQDAAMIQYGTVRSTPTPAPKAAISDKLQEVMDEQEELFEDISDDTALSPALILHHLLEHIGHTPLPSAGVYAVDNIQEPESYEHEAYGAYQANDARIAYNQSMRPTVLRVTI